MNFQIFIENCSKYFSGIIFPAIISTIRMLSISMVLAIIGGFLLGLILILYSPDGLKPNKKIYNLVDFIINTLRSFPIIILIVAISPLTRLIVGTTIGEKAAIFPLTISAIPFMARIIESSLREVDKQLIEAARSFGASNFQILTKVMLKEAVPSIVSGITLSTITFLGATTVAGAVGAGGLGAVALNYGYQSFNNTILYICVFILFIMVQIIQFLGNYLYKKLCKGIDSNGE